MGHDRSRGDIQIEPVMVVSDRFSMYVVLKVEGMDEFISENNTGFSAFRFKGERGEGIGMIAAEGQYEVAFSCPVSDKKITTEIEDGSRVEIVPAGGAVGGYTICELERPVVPEKITGLEFHGKEYTVK